MRVAVVTQYFPNSAQPWAGHSAYQTMRVLARQCEVEVFYPDARYPPGLRPASRTFGAVDPGWQPTGVRTRYLSYQTLPVISRPWNGWSMYRRLLPALRAYGPDVILSYVVYPDGFAAVKLGEALGVPVVVTAIGSDLNRLKGRIVRALTRSTLQRAAIVMTVSQDLRETAIRMGSDADRTVAILNGCDTSVFYPADRAAARTELGVDAGAEAVVYVGRLDVRKGLRELLEAIGSLSRPRLRGYLVGDGPDRGVLLRDVERLGLEDRVTFVAPVDTAGVARWMAAASLVTLPSYKEGCPNVIVEALHAGRPVVATRVGGIPELMDARSGALIPTHDVGALAGALGETLDRSWDAAVIARQHERSWEDVAGEVLVQLDRVVLGKG